MMDWKAWIPRGTGIPVMPSILRSGIATNPLVQAYDVAGATPPPAALDPGVVARIPKGSGEVVEDSFH